jgi:hypothetical protein
MKKLKAEMDASKGIVNFNEDDLRIETSKLVDSDIEQNNADVEISTLENSFNYMSDDDFISSDEESETKKEK